MKIVVVALFILSFLVEKCLFEFFSLFFSTLDWSTSTLHLQVLAMLVYGYLQSLDYETICSRLTDVKNTKCSSLKVVKTPNQVFDMLDMVRKNRQLFNHSLNFEYWQKEKIHELISSKNINFFSKRIFYFNSFLLIF